MRLGRRVLFQAGIVLVERTEQFGPVALEQATPQTLGHSRSHKRFSVKTGTIMASKVGYQTWVFAMYLLTTKTPRMSRPARVGHGG